MDMATMGLAAATSLYSAEFLMYTYKVEMCTREDNHDWARCPYAHEKEKAKRRDPRRFTYASVPCPDVIQGRTCPRGDACANTHSVQEYWLHPDRFRTQMCKNGTRCTRPLCFFAHRPEELRRPESEAPPDSGSNAALCVEPSGGAFTLKGGSSRDFAAAAAAVAAAAAARSASAPATQYSSLLAVETSGGSAPCLGAAPLNQQVAVEASGGSATSVGSRPGREFNAAAATAPGAGASGAAALPGRVAQQQQQHQQALQPLVLPAGVAVSEVLTEYMSGADVEMMPSAALGTSLAPSPASTRCQQQQQQQHVACATPMFVQLPLAAGAGASNMPGDPPGLASPGNPDLTSGMLSMPGAGPPSAQDQTARLRAYLEQQQRAVQQQREALEQQRVALEQRQQQLQQQQLQLQQLQQEQELEALGTGGVAQRIPSNTSTTSHLSASTFTPPTEVLQLPILTPSNEGLYWPQQQHQQQQQQALPIYHSQSTGVNPATAAAAGGVPSVILQAASMSQLQQQQQQQQQQAPALHVVQQQQVLMPHMLQQQQQQYPQHGLAQQVVQQQQGPLLHMVQQQQHPQQQQGLLIYDFSMGGGAMHPQFMGPQ